MKPGNESPPHPRNEDGAATDATLKEAAAAWVARRDAGMSGSDHAELNAWLAADARHRRAFDEYGFAWSLLDRPVRGGAADDVIEELRGLDRRRRQRVLAGALAAIVLVGGFSFWTIFHDGMGHGNKVNATTARVFLPERQTLPDGSVVELKAGAQIVVNFGGAQRRMALRRGEAHFQVAKEAARPFVVEANGVELRAVGTAFAVQVGNAAVDVVVTEGHVAIEKPAETRITASAPTPAPASIDRPPQTVLAPGQQALIGLGSGAPKVRAMEPDELSKRLGWRVPRLEFSGTPLTEVVALLNEHAAPWHEVRYSIGDAAIAQVRVSGLFRADNTAALLDLLDSGFGITAEHVGNSTIVFRKATAGR